MKSVINYFENFSILLPSKLPHQQTKDRIEDEKLSQMTSKDRLEYLSKKEKKEKRGALLAAGILGGGLAGIGGLGYYLSKNQSEPDFDKKYKENAQRIRETNQRIDNRLNT